MRILLWLALAQTVDVEGLAELPFAPSYRAEYVGSERCGACHEELVELRKTHHMAQTGRPALASDPLFSMPSAGVTTVPRAEDVDAILGSGVHGVTPIRAGPDRTIREELLSYSAVLGSWFRTPGTENVDDPAGSPNSPETSRACLGCHATTVAWRDDVFDASASMLGVQCERCHGPGSAHIDSVVNGSPGTTEIFNPAKLSRNAQVRFCAQCHRKPIDVEPLEVLGRARSLTRHAGAGMMMSACFRSTPRDETLTCTECHSPHRNAVAADTARYRESCLRCHADPGAVHVYEQVTKVSDCVGCHMPKESEGFYGMTFTDHWIRVPGTEPPLGSPRQRDDLNYLEILYRNEWELAGIGEERRARLALGLAEVFYGLERRADALAWVRESLAHAPTIANRLKAAAMFRQGGELDKAEATLLEAIRRDPDLLRAHFDLGEIAADRGAIADAVGHYETALAIRADFAEGQAALGSALRRLNRLSDALEHLREAERSTPNAPRVLEGLAWVLATHPDPAVRAPLEAVALAERAAAATRYRNPMVLDTLGAAYAASGDFATAAGAAKKAIEIAERAGPNELIPAMKQRLQLYESGAAFVSGPPD